MLYFTRTVHLCVSFSQEKYTEIISVMNNNRLFFVMETQCTLCELRSGLQYNTGVTSVDNSTEGMLDNEWKYTEAMERCSMDGGDGGAQAFLSQLILYWTPTPLGLCQQYRSACS